MRVDLLGTGSADGWPNPFCSCASCNSARGEGEIRGQTGVLVDGELLIDCGPEIPRAAERFGIPLQAVRIALFTHAHPDHVGPAALLFRHWAGRAEPLHIVGPPAAIAVCQPWIAPSDPVTMHAVAAGEVLDVLGYRIRVVAANHDGPDIGPAVLYDVTTPKQDRLFYASDTGPLPHSSYEQLAGAQFDVVLLELTFGPNLEHDTDHLDFRTFPEVLATLRDVGAVSPHTQVAAIHLSDHNGSNASLRAQLAAWNVALYSDGAHIQSDDRDAGERRARTLPQRTLILGGARSGKSVHAERMLAAEPQVTYVATSVESQEDTEWQQRIDAHRARRPARWETIETSDLVGVLEKSDEQSVLLIDCLTVWLARVLDETDAWAGDLSLANARLDELVTAWRSTSARVVAVTNEVGAGIVPDTESGRLFRDIHGRLNARLAAESERALLVVAGRVIDLP